MKKIFYILSIVLLFSGCSNDFLESEPLTMKVNTSFYQTPEDIEQALYGIYSLMNPGTGLFKHSFFVSELMSDDRFGGGGTVDPELQAIADFKNYAYDMYLFPWQQNYKGIYRVNMLLESISQVSEWETPLQKDKLEGEALFMRAFFYFDLARMFGTVPLVLKTEPQNLPKATSEELYAQIASDLKLAIEKLPDTPYSANDIGRATKWVAEGYLARVFLFYTGVYNQTELPLPDSGKITKAEVINYADECIANSGYQLVSDFRNLWPYSYAKDVYDYAKDNDLSWVGEEGENTEAMFSIRFSIHSETCNRFNLFFGLRMQNTYPFGYGWGCGPVNPQLWDSWDNADSIRKIGSICDVRDENIGYVSSPDQVEETYLWQKKYMPVNIEVDGASKSMFTQIYAPDQQHDNMTCNTQEVVLLRFADLMLMGAELGSSKAQEYLDNVRNRVNLPGIPVTLENIKEERRHELAFEGGRYYDLLRWHDAEKAFNKVSNIPVETGGKETSYSAAFNPETKGFLPVPESQILLSEGVLEQNSGWN